MPGPARERLFAANPLSQLPGSGLVPSASDPERTAFLRWLVFLVAAVYPTFTYGDDPKRWVTTASDELRRSTDAHRKALWQQLEAAAGTPWFLGDRSSALDVFVCVMTRWRPGRAWFGESCPKLLAIAHSVDRRPELASVWAVNFPG